MIDFGIATLEYWKEYLEGLKFVDHWQSVVQLILIILIAFTVIKFRGFIF